MYKHKHKGFYTDLTAHKGQGYNFVAESHGGLVNAIKKPVKKKRLY